MTSGSPRIHDLIGSIAGAMGVRGFENTMALPTSRRYVVLLVDGMGLQLVQNHRERAPFLSKLTSVPGVQSVVPSTTSVNLTSLGTGLLPGSHGMPGYTCRIPGTTRFLNTLRWDDSINPLEWQPHPTLFERIAQEHVAVTVINKDEFEFSGLTRCSQRGVPFVGVEHAWERLVAVCNASEMGESSLVFAYESALDFAGHAFGVDSDEWRSALETIDRDIAEIRASLPADTTLIVTADHGMIDIELDGRFDVVEHPELLDDVVVFAGEARFRHIHTEAGAEQRVADRWRRKLCERADVRLRDETLDWFGPLDPRVSQRFGDVVVASRGNFGVFHSQLHSVEMFMSGFHGSITDVERSIPVFVAT